MQRQAPKHKGRQRKSEGKVKANDGMKSRCSTAKKGEQLKAPPDMKSVMVPKDVLKQALGKFEEVDVRKLDL